MGYKSKAGHTPLMKGVGSRNPDTVRTLLELKADPGVVSESGLTALQIAESIKDTEMIKLFSRV